MGYYTILEATNLLIAQHGWKLRRCRRRFDDGPLRYVLLDNGGAVVKNSEIDCQRRQGLDLSEILEVLAHQKNAALSSSASRLYSDLGNMTDDIPY